MPNNMALRYLLSLGIMGTTPLMNAEQAVAKSTSITTDPSIAQGVSSRLDSGQSSSLDFSESNFSKQVTTKDPGSPLVSQLAEAELLAEYGDNSEGLAQFTHGGFTDPVAAEYGSLPLRNAPLESASPVRANLESDSLGSAPLESDSLESAPLESDSLESAPLESDSLESALPVSEFLTGESLGSESPASDPLENPSPASQPLQNEILSPADPPTAEADAPLVPGVTADATLPIPSLLTPAERSEVYTQAAFLLQGDEASARLRVGGMYVLSPSVLVGATVDLTTGEAFSDTEATGLSLNELYLTASPANLPEIRVSVGLLDLTSYLDRNSFAKDSVTQFFNPVFQTNPALSTVNVASQPGLLVNWTPRDELSLTAVTYSSQRGLGDLSLDSFAAEVGLREENAILRATYATSREDDQGDGFQEIFNVDRGNGQFGPQTGDREEGFGLNGEFYIPEIKLGVFGRYGWYTNQDMDVSGQTYSLGVNGLDVFLPNDRLGLAYGRQLSNDDLRQASGGPVPDVWELFYDAEVIDRLRVGVSLQQRNAWTETYLGFRVRYDLGWTNLIREDRS